MSAIRSNASPALRWPARSSDRSGTGFFFTMAGKARQQRIGAEIQRVLSELIAREVKDPRVGMVTLTAVKLSPDASVAQVFLYRLATGIRLTKSPRVSSARPDTCVARWVVVWLCGTRRVSSSCSTRASVRRSASRP